MLWFILVSKSRTFKIGSMSRILSVSLTLMVSILPKWCLRCRASVDKHCGSLTGAAREMKCEDQPEIDASHTPSSGGLTKMVAEPREQGP